jgi:hypothetical protein
MTATIYGIAVESITRQVDTITIDHTTPATLTKVGIVSYPALETAGASPTADVILVHDTTSGHDLVLNTDYTLTATGDGPTRTYTILRINTSSISSDSDSCKVTYLWGTAPNTSTPGAGYGGTSPTGTAFEASVTDTMGTSVSGLGAAAPGGSTSDPAAGAQSSSETGAPGSEYSVTEQAPGDFGWDSGAPDTEGAYGGGVPSSYVPTDTSYGATNGSTQLDTTIGGGAVHVDGTPPTYRAPTSGVAAGHKDTTLTDILGNQISAPTTPSQAAYQASNVDTLYIGAPAAPTALLSQTDKVTAATSSGSPRYYLSKQGVVPSTIVILDTTTPATLVLNTDYAVTTAGNGATTVAYIVMTSGTNFTDADNISIAYSYGDATYWDSNVPSSVPGAPGTPTGTAEYRGVSLSFAVPSGLTPVDYYLVECDDTHGTQYVPATGQPQLDGQPSPSGGGGSGQPTYQADVVGFALSTPTGLAVVTSGSAGTTHYYYRVSALGVSGETLACTEVAILTGNASLSSSNFNRLSWNAVTGATSYKVYGRATGAELYMVTVTSPAYDDKGAVVTPAGALPTANTTGKFSQSGILTDIKQVVVRDTTRVGVDALQADANVLEYGYDYTIAATGIGPWVTYVISLAAGSVNAQKGDSLTVEYWWGADPTTITTLFTQGLVPNTAVIYKPDGSTYSQHGYRFKVAAGNRKGLGAFSSFSARVVPLNPNAAQPGHEGSTQTELALDPANSVNPVYLPDGTVKAGTGLGG